MTTIPENTIKTTYTIIAISLAIIIIIGTFIPEARNYITDMTKLILPLFSGFSQIK